MLLLLNFNSPTIIGFTVVISNVFRAKAAYLEHKTTLCLLYLKLFKYNVKYKRATLFPLAMIQLYGLVEYFNLNKMFNISS